jgi:hypothetical protein
MIPTFLNLEITNNFLGPKHQIRNQEEIQRMLNQRLEPQNQEQTTQLLSINHQKDQEKSMFLVDMVVLTMKEKPLMIFTC